MMAIASRCSDTEIQDMMDAFRKIDTDGSGTISIAEFQAALNTSGLQDTELNQLWESMDLDKSGLITYSEFLAATMEKSIYAQEDKLWEAFKVFDSDGNGKISEAELKKVLTGDTSPVKTDIWRNIISAVDKDEDGKIDFNEFCVMMTTSRETHNIFQ
jgi:calcium-dependent protein kinase